MIFQSIVSIATAIFFVNQEKNRKVHNKKVVPDLQLSYNAAGHFSQTAKFRYEFIKRVV